MALLSGEVETVQRSAGSVGVVGFRMALLSGEVETMPVAAEICDRLQGSGWLCYPGKLKHGQAHDAVVVDGVGSGWLCYPGKLKQHGSISGNGHAVVKGSGWLCYPGKLKQ